QDILWIGLQDNCINFQRIPLASSLLAMFLGYAQSRPEEWRASIDSGLQALCDLLWRHLGIRDWHPKSWGSAAPDHIPPGLSLRSRKSPLISRQVPRGTNGGISLIGTAASVAGGTTIGLAFFLAGWITAVSSEYRPRSVCH